MAKFSIKSIGSKAKKSLIKNVKQNKQRNNDHDGIKQAALKSLKFIVKRFAPQIIQIALVATLFILALLAGSALASAITTTSTPFTVTNPKDPCAPAETAAQRARFIQIFVGEDTVAGKLVGSAADFVDFATGWFYNRSIEVGCEEDIDLEYVEGWTWPILRDPPLIISEFGGFGPRPNVRTEGASKDHKGVDYAYPCGVPVVAANSGVVVDVRFWSTYGEFIQINHDFESQGANLTRYAHLKTGSILVSPGQRVSSGQIIAQVGNTSTIQVGCHLHFEVHRGGPIDPHGFVERMIQIQKEREEREAREDRARADSAARRGQ